MISAAPVTPKDIGQRFGVSQRTVRIHLRKLYRPVPDGSPWLLDPEQVATISAKLSSLGYPKAPSSADADTFSVREVAWTPPAETDLVVDPPPSPETRIVSRAEFRLQGAFGKWLLAQGTPPMLLPLPSATGVVHPDFYVPGRHWIVEAKASAARQHVRMAIGQVLDYCHLAHAAGLEVTPVILLPECPSSDLVELMHSLGISLSCPSGREFIVAEPVASA